MNEGTGGLNKLKSAFEYVSQHITLILLIPTLLGGVWQVMALGTMSIAYIRFFSIGQLLSDGIIISIWLCLWALNFLILYWMLRTRKSDPVEEPLLVKLKKTKKARAIGVFGYLIVSCFLSWSLYSADDYLYNNLDFWKMLFIPSIIYFVTIIIVCWSFVILLFFDFDPDDINTNKALKNSVSFLTIVGLLYIFYVFFNVLTNFNKAFVLPENIENSHNLLETMREEDSTYIYQIGYMNDLYVFVNVSRKKDSTLSSVKVFKTDSFFEAKNFREPGEYPNLQPKLDSLQEAWKQQDSIYDIRIKESIRRTDSMKTFIFKNLR